MEPEDAWQVKLEQQASEAVPAGHPNLPSPTQAWHVPSTSAGLLRWHTEPAQQSELVSQPYEAAAMQVWQEPSASVGDAFWHLPPLQQSAEAAQPCRAVSTQVWQVPSASAAS